MAEPPPLDASGYLRGLAGLLGGSCSTSLPVPDDDEAPADPALDAPWSTAPPGSFIDPAWWEVYGRRLVLERLERDEWIDSLAMAYRLVRRPDSLTRAQLRRQDDMVARSLGHVFLPTRER